MKISKNEAANLIQEVQKKIKPVDIDNSNFIAYFLDDITVIFVREEKVRFFGITLEVLGRTFSVIDDLTITIKDTEEDDNDDNIYSLEDQNMTDFLNKFLALRTELIRTFGA